MAHRWRVPRETPLSVLSLSSQGYADGFLDIHLSTVDKGAIHPFYQSRILIDKDPVPRGFLSLPCHHANVKLRRNPPCPGCQTALTGSNCFSVIPICFCRPTEYYPNVPQLQSDQAANFLRQTDSGEAKKLLTIQHPACKILSLDRVIARLLDI